MGNKAWNPVNTLTHVVVPIASIIDFFVTGINSNIPKKKVMYVILPPLVYAIYAGIGYVLNRQFAPGINYPYFFLNWGSPAGAFGFSNQLPFMGTGWWIVALIIIILAMGWIYLKILDGIKKIVKK